MAQNTCEWTTWVAFGIRSSLRLLFTVSQRQIQQTYYEISLFKKSLVGLDK